MQASEFDAWASLFCEPIEGVRRDIWDVFARHKFLNWLLSEGDIQMQEQPDGTILLIETEVFSSVAEPQMELKSEGGNGDKVASKAS